MRGWEGLYGRPRGGGRSCSSKIGAREQDAGDHKGPHHPTSTTLAPTDVDGLVGRLMPSGLTLEAGGGQFRPSFA